MLRAIEIEYEVEGKRILKGVSIEAKRGITAILGPNGAGKTTLLKCVVGILRPNRGKVFLGDLEITELREEERARLISYVPQELPRTFPYTAFDMVLMGRNPHVNLLKGPEKKDEEVAKDAMRSLGIDSLSHRYYNTLSGGEKRLVLIARAIAQGGKVMVMDEPTSFLDYGNQIKVMEICRKICEDMGIPILISVHDPNLALRCCDYVYLISEGQIISEGPPNEAINLENLKRMYGVRGKIVEVSGRKILIPERFTR